MGRACIAFSRKSQILPTCNVTRTQPRKHTLAALAIARPAQVFTVLYRLKTVPVLVWTPISTLRLSL